jgi:hypothetical protein
MESVYLETTVVSYLVSRPSVNPLVAARQELTRQWWDLRRHNFACYVSEVVIQEAGEGDFEQAARRLGVIEGLPKLAASAEAERLSALFLETVLPERAALDAAHLAIATVAGIQFLLTWNCAHLANAQVLDRLEPIALRAGFKLPRVCTPDELMGVLPNDDW